MELEFRLVEVEKELRRLRDFDRRVFPAADLFPASYWRECEVYWMVVDGRRVGCCALQAEANGVLAISSSGILPAWQGMGLGRVMKAWQVAYARGHGFRRMVTTTRAGNERMIQLNEAFGFRIVGTVAGYYVDPEEAGVEMELAL
ncbi:MAG: N-acetyltransferase family protein [Bryobacteraceae bacterium]